MARHFLARQDIQKVFVSSRDCASSSNLVALANEFGDRVCHLDLDVTDEGALAAAAVQMKEHCDRLHLICNLAAILHSDTVSPERRLEQVEASMLSQCFAVNASGPLLVVKHFLPFLEHDDRAVVANISARVGSIGDNRAGGWYGYRASKAAQNMMTKTLAIELKRRAKNVICISLHPGTVDTQLSKPFQGNVPEGKLFSPERAAAQLVEIIESLSPSESGKFFDWKRSDIPW